MQKITKKSFIEKLTENKSLMLTSGYLRDKKTDDIKLMVKQQLEKTDLSTYDASKARQGYKHSNGLKFKQTDGEFSYLYLEGGFEYYQSNNILVAMKEYPEYHKSMLLIYQVI